MKRPDIEGLQEFRKMFEGQLSIPDVNSLFEWIKYLETVMEILKDPNTAALWDSFDQMRALPDDDALKLFIKKTVSNAEHMAHMLMDVGKGR